MADGGMRRGVSLDGVAIATVLALAAVIAGYVHYSMSEVRGLLPKEILQQQQEVSGHHSTSTGTRTYGSGPNSPPMTAMSS